MVRFTGTPDVGRCYTLRSGTATRGADRDGWATQPMDARSHARTGGETDGERYAIVGATAGPLNRNDSARNAHSAPHALERSSQKLCVELHGRLPAERICLLGGVQQPVPDVRHGGANGVPRACRVHGAATRPPLAEGGRRRASAGGGQGIGAELRDSGATQVDSAQACNARPARMLFRSMESAAISCNTRPAATIPWKNQRCAEQAIASRDTSRLGALPRTARI